MREYSITNKTLAIVPFGDDKSLVYENDNCFIIDNQPKKIMEDNCKYYGSSMNGRAKGTDSLIGISYKAPIIVEEKSPIVFFPTSSPRLRKCAWISLSNIDSYYYDDTLRKSIIKFINEDSLAFSLSYNILNNQILRANRLEYIIRKRRKEK